MAQEGRVLVTGGCGFIGRSVVGALRNTDIDVTVVDREPWQGDAAVTAVQGDLIEHDVRAAAMTEDVTAVVHLAALTSVLRSVDMPETTYQQNVAITQGLLELARERGVGRFLLASTNAVVGDVGANTITTERPLRPLTPYGATKAACEMLMSGYAGAYGMATCALRFTNVYGPGMSHKDSFVPRMMRAALTGEGVRVYGTGKQSRDLVHVDDVARAVLLALDSAHTGPVIVGSGHSVSVLEMVETVRQVTGCPVPAEHIAAQKGEMPAVVVDITGSEAAIGYAPAIGLADGLAGTWKYFRDEYEQGRA